MVGWGGGAAVCQCWGWAEPCCGAHAVLDEEMVVDWMVFGVVEDGDLVVTVEGNLECVRDGEAVAKENSPSMRSQVQKVMVEKGDYATLLVKDVTISRDTVTQGRNSRDRPAGDPHI